MRILIGILPGLAVLSACQGPNQSAGADQDRAAANLAGETYEGSGPSERIGTAQDRADHAANEARDATAAARRAESENYRRQVNVEATRLDEQARALREGADIRGNELEREAAASAKQ